MLYCLTSLLRSSQKETTIKSNEILLFIATDPLVEYVWDSGGKPFVSVDGILFYRTTITKKKIYWRCRQYRQTG